MSRLLTLGVISALLALPLLGGLPLGRVEARTSTQTGASTGGSDFSLTVTGPDVLKPGVVVTYTVTLQVLSFASNVNDFHDIILGIGFLDGNTLITTSTTQLSTSLTYKGAKAQAALSISLPTSFNKETTVLAAGTYFREDISFATDPETDTGYMPFFTVQVAHPKGQCWFDSSLETLVTPDTDVTVPVHVKNTGLLSTQYTLQLSLTGNGLITSTPSVILTLDPNQEKQVSFTVRTSQVSSGSFTLTAKLYAEGTLLDQRTITVTITSPSGKLEILSSPPDIIGPQTEVTFTTQITNTGALSLPYTLQVSLDGPAILLSHAVIEGTLNPSASTTMEISFQTNDVDQLTSLTITLQLYTDGSLLDELTLQLTVAPPQGEVEVLTSLPEIIGPGEELPFSVQVSNTGALALTYVLNVEVDGPAVISPAETEGVLDPSSSATIDLSLQTLEVDQLTTVVISLQLYMDTTLLDQAELQFSVAPPEGEIKVEVNDAELVISPNENETQLTVELTNTGRITVTYVLDVQVTGNASLLTPMPYNCTLAPQESATLVLTIEFQWTTGANTTVFLELTLSSGTRVVDTLNLQFQLLSDLQGLTTLQNLTNSQLPNTGPSNASLLPISMWVTLGTLLVAPTLIRPSRKQLKRES